MSYDTPGQVQMPMMETPVALMETVVQQALSASSLPGALSKRGRPQRLSDQLLAAGLLWCLLHGWVSQWDLWRRISVFGVGSLAPVAVCDQAVYNRLGKRGTALMQQVCIQISNWLWQWLAPYEEQGLASFATQILALDESTMDAVHRWLKELRGVPLGETSLLAGRLVGLFDIRRQQWRRLDWLPQAIANCQLYAQQMVQDLSAGTLLLFDLGYYNFEWFDSLTQRGIFWVARLRRNGSYSIEHILCQRDGYFEALIFLGVHRADHSAYLMRLVRVRYRGEWYSYISNCTDPKQLSGAEIVALYARRWDIELALRLLKDHLGLRLLCSAKPEVIGAQIWATLSLAQVRHALQVQVAVQAGVPTFDVSLELLWRYWPDLCQRSTATGKGILQTIAEVGQSLKLLRPSTRIQRQVPQIPWHELLPPPPDLQWIRLPRYAHKVHTPSSSKRSSKHSAGKEQPSAI